MTYAATSRALGLPQDAISKTVKGRRELTAVEMSELCTILNCTPPMTQSEAVRRPKLIYVTSRASSGQWMDDSVTAFKEYELTTLPDTQWPIEAQFGVVIEGDSVNLVAHNGDHALCLAAVAAPRDPKAGDWVVVDHFRNNLRERTIRKVHQSEDGTLQLCHLSDDPRFTDTLTLSENPDDRVVISGFVLDFLRSGTRF